jgi:nicotinamide-nucleotide amidase
MVSFILFLQGELMRAEVISIGDELTSGQRLDTNSQWISQRLADLGIRTLFHTTVADDLESNRVAFDTACRRAEVIVATGGLGPTADDLTRESLAGMLDVDLVLDEPSLVHIKQRFVKRSRPMPESNRIQAMFPAGTEPIYNPHGTAPGILGRQHGGTFYCLPGVPAEMREMWEATVEPSLIQLLGNQRRIIRHRRIKCFGVGESDLELMLPDLIRRGREPSVGITVSQATITLRITAVGTDDQQCFQAMKPTEETIRQCLKNVVFGEEDDELHHVVDRLLRKTGRRFASLEQGTRGLIAGWFAQLDETADTVPLSLVMQDPTSLARLGIDQQTDLTNSQAVMRLAISMQQQLGVDFAAVVGRLTRPLGTDDGICPCAIVGPGEQESFEARLIGHPEVVRPRIAKQVLNRVRLLLLKP